MRNKFLTPSVVGLFAMLIISTTLHATIITFEESELYNFDKTTDNPRGNAELEDITWHWVGGVEYAIHLTNPDDDGFSQIQIGDDFPLDDINTYSFPVAGGTADLTVYDTYELMFKNRSNHDWFVANLYINTGATDGGEPNNYYENDWTWVAPGQSLGIKLHLNGVDNLDHVTNIGFNIGTNVTDRHGAYTGDYLNVEVKPAQPVPAPATFLLLFSGLVGIFGISGGRKNK